MTRDTSMIVKKKKVNKMKEKKVNKMNQVKH